MTLREDAQIIMDKALAASLPDAAVEKALKNKKFGSGRIVVVSIGKAAWQMAKTTVALLGDRISGGIVITKYQHAKGAVVALPFLKSLLFRFRNCRKSIPIFYRAAPTSFP